MNPDELVSVVSTWQPRIRVFFARRCRDRDDVDDLVQETIASIVRCYQTFSGRSTLSTWIHAVCRNVLSNYYYYRDRDHRLVQRLCLDPSTSEPEMPSALRDAAAQLPAGARRLYELYYVEGLSVRQIAARLERPEGTVKYQLFELRKQIRRILDV